MRTIYVLLFAILTVLPLSAANVDYKTLWKQVDNAASKDQPRTKIKYLEQIISKASREKSYGNLLAAEVSKASTYYSISPDSLSPAMNRLKKKAADTNNAALKATYNAVIAEVYEASGNEDSVKIYFDRALVNPEPLAKAYAGDYQPLLIKGADGKVFGDDLLHVIGIKANKYKLMEDFYGTHGNKAAALTAAVLGVVEDYQLNDDAKIARLDSLSAVYKDNTQGWLIPYTAENYYGSRPVAEHIAFLDKSLSQFPVSQYPRMAALQNSRNVITDPRFFVSLDKTPWIPTVKNTIKLTKITNVDSIKIEITRLKADGTLEPDNTNTKQLLALRTGNPVFTATRTYTPKNDYEQYEDSIEVPQLPVGVYLVKAFAPNQKADPVYNAFFVSDLKLIYTSLNKSGRMRLAVVNATTGQPISQAKISLTENYSRKKTPLKFNLTTNKNGECQFEIPNGSYDSYKAYVTCGEDKYLPQNNIYKSFSYWKSRPQNKIRILTDRSIYRPGQKLFAAIVVWAEDSIKTNAVAGMQETIVLKDANYKTIAEKTVTTNGFGTANTWFDIPAEGLTGAFHISGKKLGGSTTVRVEEYKRPTFRIEFDDYKQSYSIGDTVKVKGRALSYSDVPVQNAKVEYKVSRAQAWWWWRRSGDLENILTANATTDDNGEFTVLMPMTLPSSANPHERQFYSIEVQAKVTSQSGESHEENTSLPLGTRPTVLTTDLPQKSVADSLRHITFTRLNMAGKQIDGEVNFIIDGRTYKGKANTVCDMPKLKSGSHNLVAICGNDTLRQQFVVFTLNDKRPAVATPDWFYASGTTVGKDIPVYVQVGSSEQDQHVFYTIYEADKLLESGSFDVSNSINTRKFADKYDGNLSLNYIWVRNGEVYSHSCKIAKQLPSKKLKVSWTTFRDKLVPGQKEKWTLNVVAPNGNPARASLISTLYDKSLDQLYSHNWTFNIEPSLPTATAPWIYSESYGSLLYYSVAPKNLRVDDINYWTFNEKYFELYYMPVLFRGGKMRLMAKNQMLASAAPGIEKAEALQNDAALPLADIMADSVVNDGYRATGAVYKKVSSGQSDGNKTLLRTNLNETVFFIPNAETDKNGNVSLSFTLPESVTTWRFMGFAHDSLMNYGSITANVIAQKQIMVQPNMPRFIRQGDQATISSTVTNTTANNIDAIVTLQLIDAATDSVLFEQSKQSTVKANGTIAVGFSFDSNSYPDMLICRVTASGNGYSDGEQNYLAVLSPYERVIDTHPFTINGSGTKTIDLSSVKGKKPKLTVEYTANPSLLVLSSLHSIANPDSKNAISLVTSIYANRLGQYILSLNPKMKQYAELWAMEEKQTSFKSNLQKNEDLKDFKLNETPWIQDAENEESQKRSLIYFYDDNTVSNRLSSAMTELKKLQNGDGSFSWWKGMVGSAYMTLSVNRTLVRLQKITGEENADATKLIDNSFRFLDTKIAEEVAELKRLQKKYGSKNLCPSDFACDYLYSSALYGRKHTADMTYLVGLLAKMPTRLTIYGKANSAVILAYFNQKLQANEYLKSLKEYTVYKAETGRYFDTPKAYYSWFDYRIPTQTAAIEALKLLSPVDKKTITEMQYWLLQEKRTTQWSTPLNTANAVYAFLDGGKNVFNANGNVSLTVDGRTVSLPKAAIGTGYFRMDLPSDASAVAISKTGTGASWGALYAQYTDHSANIKRASSGISIARKVECGANPTVGDKVKVVITIKADRDYDFVAIADRRAACLEPANQLSGYNGQCYEETRDRQTNYFFDRLPKGTWQVSTEYFIDREGNYQIGTATVGCAYAPEYSGRDAAVSINVK